MLKRWNITRATGIGAVAGLLALIIWPFHHAFDDLLLIPYAALVAVAAFCGLSILFITARDMALGRRRGFRVVPHRTFDIAIGLVLVLPSLWVLHGLL
jgi:hypothetical protein